MKLKRLIKISITLCLGLGLALAISLPTAANGFNFIKLKVKPIAFAGNLQNSYQQNVCVGFAVNGNIGGALALNWIEPRAAVQMNGGLNIMSGYVKPVAIAGNVQCATQVNFGVGEAWNVNIGGAAAGNYIGGEYKVGINTGLD